MLTSLSPWPFWGWHFAKQQPGFLTPAHVMVLVLGALMAAQPISAAEAAGRLMVPACDQTVAVAVELPLAAAAELPPTACQLVEEGAASPLCPAQWAPAIAPDGRLAAGGKRLLAAIPPRQSGPEERTLLFSCQGPTAPARFHFKEISDKSLQICEGDAPVLVYNHGLITNQRVPQSDHRRSRACYVHPLWGLNGEVLTDDFPRDHYHHHGVFWTWPHVAVAGQEHDLWAGSTIQDRFVRWICREVGPVAAVLAVENGWFVGEKQVMVERVWLRVYSAGEDSRAIDLEFTWVPTDQPVTLWGAGGKSYGGLTVRFAPRRRQDTVITVPSGRTSGDLPDTPLKWADLTSTFGESSNPSGAAVFVHPDHPDYPPTWLTRHYGPLCVGWPGVRPKTFPAGEPIRLNYRIWIHKTPVELPRLRAAYDAYLAAVKARWD